jgi:hypothetical protein
MGIRNKTAVSNQIKKDLVSLSSSLRNVQLTIAEAAYALKHHVIVNIKDLQVVEIGINELDALNMQLISLSYVGHRTYERLEKNELLIQSLRSVKTTMGATNTDVNCLSNSYIKSRNSVLSLLKANIDTYTSDAINNDDIDMDAIDKTLTEKVKDLLTKSPIRLVEAYCDFYFDVKEKVEIRSKKPIRKSNDHSDIDKDIEVMRSLYTLAEAYRDVQIKNLTCIEELLGIIKGIHLSQLQFDIPLIENLSMLSLSVVLGVSLAIRELVERH